MFIDCKRIICAGIISISLTACGQTGDYSYSVSTNSNSQQANVTKTKSVIGQVHEERIWSENFNGNESHVEANGDFVFSNGKPTKWSKDSIIRLRQSGYGFTKEGEMRPEGETLKVWIKVGKTFRPGDKTDDQWAEEILAKANWDDRSDAEKVEELGKMDADAPDFKVKSGKVQYSKNMVAMLTKKIEAPTLTSAEQLALLETIMEQVQYDSDQKQLLLELIKRKDFSKEAGSYIVDHIDKISHESDRKQILKAMLPK